MNTDGKAREIDFSRFAERTNGFSSARNITTNTVYFTKDKMTIPAKRMWVLELQK
jgi:hypothetical protein